MKILHIIDSLKTGGKERRLIECLKTMQAFPDVDIRLLVLSAKSDDFMDAGFISAIHLPRGYRKDPSIYAKLFRVCRQYKPDIIHSWESMCSMYAAPVANLLKIKFINAMIAGAPRIGFGHREWVRSRLTFPFSDLILANSRAGLLAYNSPLHKSACVHNGFDFNRLRDLQPAEEIRVKSGIHTPKVVGMVATVDDRKDHVNFVRAAVQVCEARNDVSFIAIGAGPLLNRCRQMVPELLADRILFPGHRSDIESHIQIFDIGVLFTHGEGISNAIMEYMALAKPVIATAAGGTVELVVEDRTGFLIRSNTDKRVNDYIHYLLDNPSIAGRMGCEGRKRIESEFSIEKMAGEILALYRTCLNANVKSLKRIRPAFRHRI